MKSSKLQWMISASFKKQKKFNKRFTTIATVLTI